jgi:hypothetical protein
MIRPVMDRSLHCALLFGEGDRHLRSSSRLLTELEHVSVVGG